MTTVDDKLKLFARIVFEKVERESEQKVSEFSKNQDKALEAEKQNILKDSESYIRQAKKKAEDKKRQIISKANIERQHVLLKKRKEIFDRAVEDIKELAFSFTNQPEYLGFMEKCIKTGLSGLETKDAAALFCRHDIDMYGKEVLEYISKYRKPGVNISIMPADEEILGGCIFEDVGKTIRIDCSMASIIEDNKGLIGNMLMDNLQ